MGFNVRRRTDAKMNERQIRAAWKLYEKGWTVPGISRALWGQFGFKTQNSCCNSLYHAFKNFRYATRSPGEANTLRTIQRGCKGCGCHPDERTTGCAVCNSRHYWRRKKGKPLVRPRVSGFIVRTCRKCGTEYSNYTKGCASCARRKYEMEHERPEQADRVE